MNDVVLLVGMELVSSDACSVTGAGMEEICCHRRKRKVRAVVMVVGAADAGQWRAGEGQLEPCPCPACVVRRGFDWYWAN